MKNSGPASVRLMYITYHENILYSGILRSQVQKMLEGLPAQKDVELTLLLCFINPYHFWRDRNKWRALKSELSSRGVRLVKRPMFFTSRWPWWTMVLTLLISLPAALWEAKRFSVNILHSRSYVAGIIAQAVRELTGIEHVFDPRGTFPDEMTANKFWKVGGPTHRFWLKAEARLIRRASAVAAVTPGYRELYRRMGAAKAVFIPNRGEVRFFSERSRQVSLTDTPTLVFCGGMESAWYHPQRVGSHFLAAKSVIPNLRLYIISHFDRQKIWTAFQSLGIGESDWFAASFPPSEVPEQMARGDLGLILGFNPEVSWPVKFAEYLACGVPLVVDKRIGKYVTGQVEKWGLGVVVDEEDRDSFQQIKEELANRADYSRRCRDYALKRLDIARTSFQTARMYRQILRIC